MQKQSSSVVQTGTLDQRLGAAFQLHEREGLKLAAHLRAIAMLAITIWLFVLLEHAAWFYVPVTALFIVSGYLHFILSRQGYRSDVYASLFFLFDVVLVTFALLAPNPLLSAENVIWPEQMAFRFGGFNYYFMMIALFLLGSYSARAMLLAGCACVIAWGSSLIWISTFASTIFEIPGFDNPGARLERFLDPLYVSLDVRFTEVLVLLITTMILATAVARSRRLIRELVHSARERSNLARYFPPNIVEELAGHDRVLGTVRSQKVAVMFADMVGFTHMAEVVSPEELIDMLRAFHRRVESAIFENQGTLDKYLGDGVLATFGTPNTGPTDAANAIRCARQIFDQVEEWNERRIEAGFPSVRLSIGLHYGDVVVGDVGTERRLEFAVIGDTVNVASRLEESTRAIGCKMVVSNDLVEALIADTPDEADGLLIGLKPHENLELRGRDGTIHVWTFGAAE